MTERPGWRLSTEATRVAFLISSPFAVLGSYAWLIAPLTGMYEQDEIVALQWLGHGVYLVGRPLTGLVYLFRPFEEMRGVNHQLLSPLANLLLFWQLMIWTQLVALGGRALERLCMWLDDKFPLE